MDGRFIAYYRVSTRRQGDSGLGLEAQRTAVKALLNGGAWRLMGEFTEVESGKRSDRPQLEAALAECRLTGATLVVAKLDRLARNLKFLLNVIEGCAEAGVLFCDLPQIQAGPVGKFMIQQMASVAELEAGLISTRTKDALAASKARGVVLGGYRGGPKVDGQRGRDAQRQRAITFAARVKPIAAKMRDQGMSLRQIAAALTKRGVETSRRGAWTAAAVSVVLAAP